MEAVVELLQQDVQALVGPRYARGQRPLGLHRWTRQAGSIYLADQKLRILRPRVRNRPTRQEVPLQTYAQLQHPRAADEGVLRRILHGLSCREYRACAEAVPEAFGLSASTMSRRYIRASARKLQVLQERRLDQYAFVALVLDGKTFQDDTLVVALGITVQGEKVLLGFVETGTENETACAEFLQGLVERGLRDEDGLLIVMDGGKGLRAGARRVFGADTPSNAVNGINERTWWPTCPRRSRRCGAASSSRRTHSRPMRKPKRHSKASGESSSGSMSPPSAASTMG